MGSLHFEGWHPGRLREAETARTTGPASAGETTTTALVVYESMFGNTARAAGAVAHGLREAGVRVDVVEVDAAPTALPEGLDLLVVAAPTHASRVRWLPQAASTTIVKLARRRGLTPAGHHLGLVVNDVKGPLADGERERAVEYGAQLAHRCRRGTAQPR